MAQQTEFPKIPSTKPGDYRQVITGLLEHVDREKPDYRELKRYMRSRSIFDKDSADQLFELIGVKTGKGKTAALTTAGKKLLEIEDDTEWKKALFMTVAERNEILVKYAFDGLFERLYSVNEMYRVITSYVYPGKVITLPAFKNWMGWIEATGMIKYIGIRWGPAPLVKDVESYLLGIDVEDILEDEGMDDLNDLELAELDLESEGELSGEESELAEELDDEDIFDMPPGGIADFDDDLAPAAASRSAPQGTMPAYQARLTLRSVAEIQEVQKVLELDPAGAALAEQVAALDEAEIARNLQGLRTLWTTRKGKDPLSFKDFGLDSAEYTRHAAKKKRGFFLYRGLVAATCAFRPTPAAGTSIAPAQSPVDRFAILNDSGALSRHYLEGQPLDDVLTALVATGHGTRLDLLAVAPYMALARQALENSEQWIAKLEKRKSAAGVWESVYERLHADVFTIELFWLVRELARDGLWKAEGLLDTAVVPTSEALDVAFRIGMLSTPYLGSFAAGLFTSRTLTGFCGADEGWEAGLLHFAAQLGCSYNCTHRTTCTYFCRERLRR